jgi:ribonuclease BN (tRNA processing enzyme)
MRLTVLGCSGSVPMGGAAASGYLLSSGPAKLVLDLGNGTLSQLGCCLDPFDLNALVFSHLHADHCADFPALTVYRRYHPNPPYDPRWYRLPVYAPDDAAERFAMMYAPCAEERAGADLSDVHEFHSLPEEPARLGPFTLRAVPVAHPCPAYGLRVSAGGRTLAYTGDTGPVEALRELTAGADTVLSEATWTAAHDRPESVHLSGAQAGELAAAAGTGRLLLTHIAPWTRVDEVVAEARAAFAGEVRAVRQGEAYDI